MSDLWAQQHPVLAEVETLARGKLTDVAPVLRRWEHELERLRSDREILIRGLALASAVLRDLGHGGLAELPMESLNKAGALPLEKEGVSASTTGKDMARLGRVALERRRVER